MPTALITGASAGLGQRTGGRSSPGGDGELIITGRRADLLTAVARELCRSLAGHGDRRRRRRRDAPARTGRRRRGTARSTCW